MPCLPRSHPRGRSPTQTVGRLCRHARPHRGPTMTGAAVGRRSARRGWLMWIGALIGLGALAWVLRRFEFDRFLALVRDADVRFLTLIALAIMAEQLVRAWKWRQLLHPLRPGMGVLRLFGAIMAGYLLAIMFPFGLGTVARSWLVARREDLRFASVL